MQNTKMHSLYVFTFFEKYFHESINIQISLG